MVIIKSTPAECFSFFRAHVASLISKVLDEHAYLGTAVTSPAEKMTLAFYKGGPTTLRLRTKAGSIHFYLAQSLEAVKITEGSSKAKFRLRTRNYWYRIQERPELTAPAVFRWEYDPTLGDEGSCRHHLQITGADLPGLDLNRLHIPTGWVTMEEVFRFLIVEYGVKPPCGSSWPEVLKRSEKSFFREFTSDDPRRT